MKKALVTGHMGFVGRHLLPALKDDCWDVTGIDIKEGNDCRDFFKEDTSHFDLVVHLAAIVGGRALIEGSPLAVAVDLAIDSDMFQWAVTNQPGRVVYYSSSAAYPIRWQSRTSMNRLFEGMINLDDIESPDLTYGWAKLTGEMLSSHARKKGVPVTVLRPFSGYGEDQDLDYPWPSFLERAKKKESPFQIWGDGTQTRDWIHIDDIVAATLVCVNEGIDGPLNLGTGRRTSFLELKELMCGAAGYNPPVHYNSTAPTGVHHRVCSPNKMLDVYKPRITLEDAIRKALDV